MQKVPKKKMWGKLAEAVSQVGYTKTPEQVQNFWQKLRLKAKTYRANRIVTKKTGNDVDLKIPLNTLLEQVLAIVGTCRGTGLSIVREIGIKREAATKSATMPTIKSVRAKMNIRGMTPSQSSTLASQCNSDGEGSRFEGVESMKTQERSNASASAMIQQAVPEYFEQSSSSQSSCATVDDLTFRHFTPKRLRTSQQVVGRNANTNRVVYIAQPQLTTKSYDKENAFKSKYPSYTKAWATKPNQTILRSQETLLALQNNSNAMGEMSQSIARLTEASIKKNYLLEKPVEYLKEIYELKKKK